MPEPPPPIQVIRSTTSKPPTLKNSTVVTLPTSAVAGAVSTAASGSAAGGPRKVLIPVSQPLTPQALQALSSQGLIRSSGMTPDGKRIIVVKKSASGGVILPRNAMTAGSASNTTLVMANPSTVTSTVPLSGSKATVAIGQRKTKVCQECKAKPSKFECSGCSQMWYCSKECQEKNWSKHENECGTKTIIKTEVIDD